MWNVEVEGVNFQEVLPNLSQIGTENRGTFRLSPIFPIFPYFLSPILSAQNVMPTDTTYSEVLNEVRNNLGRNIDFAYQGDREAIGNTLIEHVRQTGGCELTGCN